MGKIFVTVLMAVSMFAMATPTADAKKKYKYKYKYRCYRHHKGKVKGKYIVVKAYSKTKAQSKAYKIFKNRGLKIGYAKCYKK